MRARFVLLVVVLFALPLIADEFPIDLSKENNLTTTVQPMTGNVVIRNRVPGKQYDVTVALTNAVIKPLDPPKQSEKVIPKPDPCDSLRTAATALHDATEEAAVPKAVDAVRAALKLCTTDGALIASAALLMDATEVILPTAYTLTAGMALDLTVKRHDLDKTWKKTFTTAPPGHWATLSTLAFVPHSDREYFSKDGGNSTFVITRTTNRKLADVVPAALFTWLPTKHENDYYVWSVAGGLGFDTSNPVALFGLSVTFNQNVGAAFGVIAHKENRLNGQYHVGDVIKSNLTPAQLVESSYRPSLFVAFTFRFADTKQLGK